MDLFNYQASSKGNAEGMMTPMNIHRKEFGEGGGDVDAVYRGGGSREGSSSNLPIEHHRDDLIGAFQPPSPYTEFRNHMNHPLLSIGGGEQVNKTVQLTIFYDGSVKVYDNVSADRAHAIMALANQSSTSAEPSDVQDHEPTKGVSITTARERSIKRFMEKRRGR